MAVAGRSSGNQQTIAFGNIANELQRAAFNFGAMAGAAQQLYASLQVFRDLEKQLVLVNAIANGTSESFVAMQKSVRDFALGTTFTAAQSANALLLLAQAGFDTQQSMTAMTGVLTLAQATLEEVNETADLVASTLTSFALDADQAGRVANLFAASMNQSLASLPKLAFALRQVGPVMGSMGISVEDTTAALSELFNVGLRGEQAGTALRNVMVNIISPAGEAAKIMNTLGVQVNKADGSLRDMFDILKDLARFNLSDADLSSLFGREALAGGIALLESARNGSLERMRENISNTQEATRVALEQMSSLDSQIRLAQNAIDEFRFSLGEELGNSITGVLGWITDMGIAWRELDTPTKQYIVTLGKMTATFGLVTAVGRRIVPMLGDIAAGLVSYSKTIAQSVQDTSLLVRVWRQSSGMSFASHMGALGTTAMAAAPAVGALAVAIAGVGGLVYALNEAKKAADAAKLDEFMGDLRLNADNVRRDFSNLRQMSRAGNDPDLANAFAEKYRATKDLAEIAKKELADVQRNLDNVENLQANISKKFEELTLQPIFNPRTVAGKRSTIFDADVIFGIPENADTQDAAKAITEFFQRQYEPILSAVNASAPRLMKKFNDDFAEKISEAVDEGQTPARIAALSKRMITDLTNGIYGNLDLSGAASALKERQGKLQKDLDSMTDYLDVAVDTDKERLTQAIFDSIKKQIVNTLGVGDRSDQQAEELFNTATEAQEKLRSLIEEAFTRALSDNTFKIDRDLIKQKAQDLLVDTGVVSRKDFDVAENAVKKNFSLITKYSLDILQKASQDADRDLQISATKLAAARGDKVAEKALRDIETVGKLAEEITSYAKKVNDAVANRLQSMGGKEIAKVVSGEFVADLLRGNKEEQAYAMRLLDDNKAFMDEIRLRIKDVFDLKEWQSDLVGRLGSIPELDAEAIFAPLLEMRKAIEGGADIRESVRTAFANLEKYFLENMEITDRLLLAAGIPIATLNDAQKSKLAAETIAYMNGAEFERINSKTIQDVVREAFASTDTWLGKVGKAAAGLWEKVRSQISLANAMAQISQGGESANTAVVDEEIKKLTQGLQDYANRRREALDNFNTALDLKTDKRGTGSKGKTKEQILAELNEFVAKRNQLIIDSALELAAFGESFDINDFLDLRIKAIDADYVHQIAQVREEYAKMLKTVAKGSDDYNRLISIRDREIDQLELLKQKQLEYANSAEFAARVAQESAQRVLDKYIEMNTYTGSFFQGLWAGMSQNRLQMQTEFEIGMQTYKELIDGVTTFGTSMFTDYFTQVATGQKTMTQVLKENLAKMLMDWANYFAQLAMKYLANYILGIALNAFGGSSGGGIGLGGGRSLLQDVFDSANGRAYDQSFARGGITAGTEYFGFSKEHKIGRRGEAGDEATMPLARDSKGRLGVISLTDDKSEKNKTGNVLTYQSTMSFDLGSGGQNEDQQYALMQKIEQRTKDVALQTIAEEMRVGGMLRAAQGG